MAPNLHPLIDNGLSKGSDNFAGGRLHCHCTSNPVEVTLKGNVLHNHACGCSQCWRPKGGLFSIIAVIPADSLSVTANGERLEIVKKDATILRHTCKDCGMHLYGRIEKDHAFQGLDFVHVELSDKEGWQEPQFAAFVSSIIEQGFDPAKMDEVRTKLRSVGLDPYDALSLPLMDAQFQPRRMTKVPCTHIVSDSIICTLMRYPCPCPRLVEEMMFTNQD